MKGCHDNSKLKGHPEYSCRERVIYKRDPNWILYRKNQRKAVYEAFMKHIQEHPAYLDWDKDEMRRARNKAKAARRALRGNK